jgi:hypothetical protein
MSFLFGALHTSSTCVITESIQKSIGFTLTVTWTKKSRMRPFEIKDSQGTIAAVTVI